MVEVRYNVLRENEIRVLRPKSNTILDFDVVVLNIENNPRYYALSYVWGPSIFNHRVIVDDRPCKVTANLYDALAQLTLRQLRKSPLLSSRDYIWADAICIDQERCENCMNKPTIFMSGLANPTTYSRMSLQDKK